MAVLSNQMRVQLPLLFKKLSICQLRFLLIPFLDIIGFDNGFFLSHLLDLRPLIPQILSLLRKVLRMPLRSVELVEEAKVVLLALRQLRYIRNSHHVQLLSNIKLHRHRLPRSKMLQLGILLHLHLLNEHLSISILIVLLLLHLVTVSRIDCGGHQGLVLFEWLVEVLIDLLGLNQVEVVVVFVFVFHDVFVEGG